MTMMTISDPRRDSAALVYLMQHGKSPAVRQLAWQRWVELLNAVRRYDVELFNELSLAAIRQASVTLRKPDN